MVSTVVCRLSMSEKSQPELKKSTHPGNYLNQLKLKFLIRKSMEPLGMGGANEIIGGATEIIQNLTVFTTIFPSV